MIPASHFLSVITAEREEQMRRSQRLVAWRSVLEPRPGAAARMIAAWRTRRANGAAPADRPSPAATCTAPCC